MGLTHDILRVREDGSDRLVTLTISGGVGVLNAEGRMVKRARIRAVIASGMIGKSLPQSLDALREDFGIITQIERSERTDDGSDVFNQTGKYTIRVMNSFADTGRYG